MDETLESALQKAVKGGLSSEAKVEVFTLLRRSVPKTQNDTLKRWEAKDEVLQFLVEFYEEKKLYHRQVISLLELLLQQPGWAAVRKDWPEEMAKVAAAAAKSDVAQAEVEAAGGYTASDLPVAPQRSMADTLAMLEDSLQRLSNANFSFTVLTGSGLEEDDLVKAFELFRRAVCRVTQDQRIEMSVLDQIGRKESILQFLLEVMDRKPRHKKRIESLLVLLLQLDSWRRVAENESLKDATAKYRGNLEKEDANANDADVDVPLDEVKELLADAKRRGAIGVLLVRVVAAYDLINADWFSLSDPYAKVTVDKVSKTTAVVDDCLDPCWDEDLWNFDVMAESSFVRLEVWDKDSIQDDPLGSVAIPITMTPSELKNLRFQLDRVAHGELEVEMQFLRVEMDETDETGEPELLKSGSRKLPGPKAQGS